MATSTTHYYITIQRPGEGRVPLLRDTSREDATVSMAAPWTTTDVSVAERRADQLPASYRARVSLHRSCR